ncbi:uncharacterized protein METZ01_LOCUS233310 [marine metagenome]|uniref:Uncharacterized protein n=1 Tax=marine metagenome TaxID=408172 RepID=A0A382GZE2_9ZZZZ
MDSRVQYFDISIMPKWIRFGIEDIY